MSHTEIEQDSIPYREKASALQERIGYGGVSAATSNAWHGAYCIIDFDTLERLIEQRDDGLQLSDEAIMAGCRAVRQMLMLRVGGQAEHAQAFRDAAGMQPPPEGEIEAMFDSMNEWGAGMARIVISAQVDGQPETEEAYRMVVAISGPEEVAAVIEVLDRLEAEWEEKKG